MMPSIIVLNMSVDGYFLPGSKIETTEDVIHFLNNVLKGRVKVQRVRGIFTLFSAFEIQCIKWIIYFYSDQLLGGNGILQQTKRLFYKTKSTVVVRLTYFLILTNSFLLIFIDMWIYINIYTLHGSLIHTAAVLSKYLPVSDIKVTGVLLTNLNLSDLRRRSRQLRPSAVLCVHCRWV